MRKIILNLILAAGLFLGFSNFSSADIGSFNDTTSGFSYDHTTNTLITSLSNVKINTTNGRIDRLVCIPFYDVFKCVYSSGLESSDFIVRTYDSTSNAPTNTDFQSLRYDSAASGMLLNNYLHTGTKNVHFLFTDTKTYSYNGTNTTYGTEVLLDEVYILGQIVAIEPEGSNQTCEIRTINHPYKTSFLLDDSVDTISYDAVVNDNYKVIYNKGLSENRFSFENIENFALETPGDLSSFSFDSLDSPLEDNPKLFIESDKNIDYLKFSGIGTAVTISSCDNNAFDSKKYDLLYSDEYYSIPYGETKCLYLEWEKEFFTSNAINLDWGEKNIQYIESEICWDTETSENPTINGNELTEEEFEDIKNDGVYDEGGDGFDLSNLQKQLFTGFDEGVFELGTIQTPENIEDGTCEMFNENGNFTYYSNGQFTFEISLDSYEFLDFGVVDLRNVGESIMGVITSPINSFISIIGIITPFGEEPRNYCLFGTIVPYENHRMYKGSEFYNEMNVISYFFLFCAYAGLFSLGLKIRDFKKGGSKNED